MTAGRHPDHARWSRVGAAVAAGLVLAGLGAIDAGPPASAHVGAADDPQATQRIVNGRDPKTAELSFVVLVTDRATRRWTCGGALVTPTRVLTAAHCVVGGDAPGAASGLLVQSAVERAAPNARTVGVRSATLHPDYDPATHRADLAVLTLEREFTGVGTASLATTAQAAAMLRAGSPVTAGGWGKVSDDDTTGPERLRVADMVVFPDASCGGGAPYTVGGRTFQGATAPANPAIDVCAAGVTSGGEQVGACGGDSGTPLVSGTGASARIVGVFAFGTCAQLGGPFCEIWRPLVAIRTTAYQGWLVAQGVPVDRAATVSAPLPPLDRTPPKVRATAAKVVPGRIATLRYRVWESTRSTRDRVIVRTYAGKAVAKKLTAWVTTAPGAPRSVRLRIPKSYRGGDFCVQSQDRAGNYSTYSCARLLPRT